MTTVRPPILRIISLPPRNPFVWDGSDLGMIHASSIIGSGVSQLGDTYWVLDIGGHRAVCIVKRLKTTFPLVVDELKPIFGLPKLGTHRIMVGHQAYLLIRAPPMDPRSNELTEDIPLDLIDEKTTLQGPSGTFRPHDDTLFIHQVRELFAFRELLGVSSSYEKSIRVRVGSASTTEGARPYPISYIEATMVPHQEKRMTPETVMKRWFRGQSMDHVVAQLLDITERGEISAKLANLRGRLEEVIRRVDAQSIWVSLYIIERAMKRVLFYTTGETATGTTKKKIQQAILPTIPIGCPPITTPKDG